MPKKREKTKGNRESYHLNPKFELLMKWIVGGRGLKYVTIRFEFWVRIAFYRDVLSFELKMWVYFETKYKSSYTMVWNILRSFCITQYKYSYSFSLLASSHDLLLIRKQRSRKSGGGRWGIFSCCNCYSSFWGRLGLGLAKEERGW